MWIRCPSDQELKNELERPRPGSGILLNTGDVEHLTNMMKFDIDFLLVSNLQKHIARRLLGPKNSNIGQ